MSEHLEIEIKDRIIEIKINKPKVNAIDLSLSQELGKAFAELRDNPELRVGIITASGEKIFSAGWDLKAVNSGEMELENWWEKADYGDGGFAGLTENWNLNKPVICALNGHAIGGGFELAMSCDLIIAADHVEFGLPEMPLGIVPDAGALQRLPRRIPHNIAMEMLFLGRRMDVHEAKQFGLVNKIVDYNSLMKEARSWASQMALTAPLAMQSVKEVLRAIECVPLQKAFSDMRSGKLDTYNKMLKSNDAAEGVAAFVEKRDPKFEGK
jgi:crotonobetainyl-CoA hydratase